MKKYKPLSKDDVIRIAKLAQLTLTKSEIELFTPQLENIICFIDKLKNVDTKNVISTIHPAENQKNRFQLISDDLKMQTAIDLKKNANINNDGYVVTKKVL